MVDYFSVFNGWMIPISRAMEIWGVDSEAAVKQCDVKISDFNDQESRLSAEKTGLLINYCNKVAGRKDFAIEVAKQFHPGMFHALGYAMMASGCLKDAFTRIARYKKVVSNTCMLTVEEQDKSVSINMEVCCYEDSKRPVLTTDCIICFFATIVQFTRETLKSEFNPTVVSFNWPKPNYDCQFLNDFFQCEIEYNADKLSISFDQQLINSPLLGGNALLTQSHEKMLDEYLCRLDKTDVVQQVKNKIYELLPLGTPAQTDIANQIGMSLRNLQRKLNEQDTSFRDLLEQTRKKLALEYITQKHLSFSEIGYLVGFSNIGNFNRAFKRWTGFTPGEYRKTQC